MCRRQRHPNQLTSPFPLPHCLQVIQGKYRVQFAADRSSGRSAAVEGENEEAWLRSLFGQLCDPSAGALAPGDDGMLELAAAPMGGAAGPGGGAGRRGAAPLISAGPVNNTANNIARAAAPTGSAARTSDAARLMYFTALGRAIAMALVGRSFVGAPLSPVLCKLLVHRPLLFSDLLHANQALFQDCLRLMLLEPGAVDDLRLKMPPTSTEGGTRGNRNANRDGVRWAGRGSAAGCRVDASNRLEYVFRKMEEQFLGRTRPELAAVRRAIFEVIPAELLAVFDHREFLMLLNGHRKDDGTVHI